MELTDESLKSFLKTWDGAGDIKNAYQEYLKKAANSYTFSADELTTFMKELNGADESVKNFLKTWDGTGDIAQSYQKHLQSASGSTSAFSSALKSMAANFGISLAIDLVIQGISQLIQHQEELRQAAETAANTYRESSSSIDDYAAKYQELRSSLLEAKGNEEETYNVKKQLLDLQTELNEKFGEECGQLDLVTDAYKDQTQAIKELNKENANRFLNEHYEAIEDAEREMTKDRHYLLSGTNISSFSEEGRLLQDIAEQYKDLGVTSTEGLDGTFSISLHADAQSAREIIHDFMTDVREGAHQLGIDIEDSLDFSSTMEMSSLSLEDANGVIEKYGEIFRQAQFAQIASDAHLAEGYNEAVAAVERYKEAVLSSETPYNDESVKEAWDHLKDVRQDLMENDSEWKQYAGIMDEIFSAAGDQAYSFYQALQDDNTLSAYVQELRGLSAADLSSMYEDNTNDNAFQHLMESAENYGLEVQDVIGLLEQLGIIHGNLQKPSSDMPLPSFTDTLSHVQSLSTGLGQLSRIYADVLDKEAFDWSSILNNEGFVAAFGDMANAPAQYKNAYNEFVETIANSPDDINACQNAFNNLATAYLYNSGVLDDLTDSTKDAAIAILEQSGIVNAAEIVETILSPFLTSKISAVIYGRKISHQKNSSVNNG